MDIFDWLGLVSAVMFGNAFSFAFFMAAMKCSRLQKQGVPDDALPLWVYAGLVAPLVVAGVGVYLLR